MISETIVLDHLIELPPSPDNKTKNRARRKSYNAFKEGKITRKPCAVCGSTVKLEMHHEDYLKPLDIVWLCQYHHQQRHIQLNEKKRNEMDDAIAAIRFEDEQE